MKEVKQAASKVRELADAKWGTRFIKDGAKETTQAVGLVRHRFEVLRILSRMMSEVKPQPESFEEAVARLGLKEEDLQLRETEFLRLARVCGTFTFLPFAWLLLVSTSLHALLLCLALTGFAGLQWMNWSMRLWQVRNRTLCDFRDFLATPGWWKEWLLPAQLTPSKNR